MARAYVMMTKDIHVWLFNYDDEYILLLKDQGGQEAAQTIIDLAFLTCPADLLNVLEMTKTLPPEEWTIYNNNSSFRITFDKCILAVLATSNVPE